MNGFFSVGTAQHFKQKYSLCTMWLMDENIEWDFSEISHGKGDIDGLGSPCTQGVREKTLTHTIDPQNSTEFAEHAAAVYPEITILHCSKTDVEEIKAKLDNSWHTDNGIIHFISGT